MFEEVDFTKFWEFREGEEPLLRLIRVTVACSMGFRPPTPFGDCESCPNKQACYAVNQGRLAAAKYRLARVKDAHFTNDSDVEQAIGDLLEEQVLATAEELPLEGCPTDEEIQIAEDTADQEEEEYVPLVEFVRGNIWKEGRGYGYFPGEGL